MLVWTDSDEKIGGLFALAEKERVLSTCAALLGQHGRSAVVGCAVADGRWVWCCIVGGGLRVQAVCDLADRHWNADAVSKADFFGQRWPESWQTKRKAAGTWSPPMSGLAAVNLTPGDHIGAILSKRDFRLARVEAIDAEGAPARILLSGEKESIDIGDMPARWFPITKWPDGVAVEFAKGRPYTSFRFFCVLASNAQRKMDKMVGVKRKRAPKAAEAPSEETIEDLLGE